MVKWSFNTETTYILYITIEIVETNKRSSLLVQRVEVSVIRLTIREISV